MEVLRVENWAKRRLNELHTKVGRTLLTSAHNWQLAHTQLDNVAQHA